MPPPELASLASPPSTPPRPHNHSLSKPMTWLRRSSSSTSTQSPPKPISDSSLVLNSHRGRPLGAGATIVRTPQDALSGPPSISGLSSEEDIKKNILLQQTEQDEGRLLPPLPPSPPLPPLPLSDISHTAPGASGLSLAEHVSHPHPSALPSLASRISSSRPGLLSHSRAPSRSTPSLPSDVDLTPPPQPPFEAILLSSVPDSAIDPSKIIVSLETCTTTYRTSLRSLVSRPSYLSSYVTSLLSPASETASIYSNASAASLVHQNNGFSSVFHDHLASSGCLPQSSTSIHVFLDRPSAPYAHVLAYLRSLPGTPEQPDALPHAVRLGSPTPSRLESLIELRDEASYLGLAELHNLCCNEIDHPYRTPLSTSVGGTGRSNTRSVHSLHTAVERCQPPQEVRSSGPQTFNNNDAARSVRFAKGESSCETRDLSLRERHRQRKDVRCDMGSPPPGWI